MNDGNWNSGGDTARADESPIQLSFEIGRQPIPLGQLRSLAAGMILDLAQMPEELVEIRAKGQNIGRGRLVEIDGKIGVRIRWIFEHGR